MGSSTEYNRQKKTKKMLDHGGTSLNGQRIAGFIFCHDNKDLALARAAILGQFMS